MLCFCWRFLFNSFFFFFWDYIACAIYCYIWLSSVPLPCHKYYIITVKPVVMATSKLVLHVMKSVQNGNPCIFADLNNCIFQNKLFMKYYIRKDLFRSEKNFVNDPFICSFFLFTEHFEGWKWKRYKCLFTYIHLDLFRSHPSILFCEISS